MSILRVLRQRYVKKPWSEQVARLEQISRWLGQMLPAAHWRLVPRPYFLNRHPDPKSPSAALNVHHVIVESTRSPRNSAHGGRLLVKWLPLIALCVVVSLMVRPGGILAQTPIAAPTINSVTPSDGKLFIEWTAPPGVTGITAYDLHYIKTSADETVDGNWTKVEDVWTGSVGLEYTLGGLDNVVGYDVQMRTVTSTDGAWSGTSTGTPRIPSPAITSVITGDGALTVVWTAPAVAATTAIDAYDLRHIETSKDETVDTNWTVVEEFWTSGSLRGVLAGLTNGSAYDVQVRAVADTDGAWSVTATGTPAEHGNAIGAATAITLGTPLGGAIDPGTDEDYFKLALSRATTILIRTSGDLDTVGELLDSGGSPLDMNDDGDLPESPANFLMWRAARAGTYYVKVSSSEEATGEYILDVRAIADASSMDNAISIDPDSSTLALADEYDDIDFFRLVLLEDSDIVIRTSGPIPTTVLELVDNNGVRIVRNDYGFLPPIDSHAVVRSLLAAGTYFIKVNRPRHGYPGPYTLHVNTIAEPGDTIADATKLSLHRVEGGRIASTTDVDYFRIVVDEEMSILVRGVSEFIIPGVGEGVGINGALLNSSGNPIQATIYEDSFLAGRAHGFTVRATLEAGSYFIKVTRSGGADSGPYSILMLNDFQLDDLLNKCSGLNTTFTDPLFGCQWNLENTGQLGGTAGEDINVADVWSGGDTGAGIYVVVVDQQLALKHEDLNVDEARSHTPADLSRRFDNSHGTNVAGIIAARDNDVGGRGVAPDATVIGHTIAVPGQSIGSRIVDEADAMTRNSDVAAVFNNSWSGADGPELAMAHQHWEAAVKTGVTEGYGGKGVLYVFAAGNDAVLEGNANLDEFKNHFHVTTVCATNDLGQRSVYSNQGANLWVCAPSGDRTENRPGIVTTENYSTYVDDFSGTSAAAPVVSGVAALVRAANTSLTWRDVKLVLAASARKNDSSNTGWEQGSLKYGSATEHYSFNHEYGFGVVDAGSAVTMAKTWVNVPSLASESTAYDRLPVRIPDDRTTVSRPITVGDGVEFVEFVEIEADFQIDNFRQLEVTLESPSGAVSVISQSNAGRYASHCDSCSLNGSFRFGTAKHLGENPEGEWTLRFTDRISGSSRGTLRSWRLTIYGHRYTPAAPTIDKVAPRNEALAVAWSAPTNVGRSSISAYDLRYILSATTDKSDSGWTVTDDVWTSSGGGALEHEIDELLVDTQYDVQVRAVNNEGDGQWSAVESAAASTDKAPFINSLAPGNGSLSFSWSAPTNSELGTVTSYDLRYIRSSVSNRLDTSWSELTSIWTAGTLEYSLVSLSNGVSYDLQIRAVTGSDQQPWSSAYPETPRTTPSAPSGVSIVDSYTSAPGGGTLHVRWNRHITWDPSSTGGAPLTGYEIRYIGSDATDKADDNWTVKQINVYPVPEQEHFLTELENGEGYDVQVRGVNDAGAGSWSITIVGTPSTKPGSPTVDSLTAGSRTITVEWSAPESDGGADVSSYDLRYIKISEMSLTFIATTIKSTVWTSGDLRATITGLEVGTQYNAQVRAVTAAGKSPWSAWKAGTTALSADAAELSSLALTGATLYPSFAARTTSYKASTGYSDTQITITATPKRDDSMVEFLDGSNQPLTDGDNAVGFQVVLSVGENVVRVRVTASDNVTTKTYAVTVSRAGEDRSLTPSPNDTVGAGVLSTAQYTVTFQGQWTIGVTPGGLPGGAHFSPIIGAVHNAGVTFLKSGEAASSGVESMAETGGTSGLHSEVNAAINAITPTALSVLSRSGNIGRQGQVTMNDVAVTTDHPRVTLVTMIAPSPDWFVGVSGLSLLDASGNWLPSHEVQLYPWDAGTENGDEFSLSNPATSPQGVITSIGGTGKFSTESIATLTFTLRSANSEPTGAPFITGAAEVGEVLTANTSGIDDADGLTSPGYVYQWVRVASGGAETDISGARSSTYTVQAADVGHQLKVRVSFTDDGNNHESLTSDATPAAIVAQVTVSFAGSVYSATEGGASATVMVVLDKDPHRTLTIPLTKAPGGGAVAADYAAPEEVVFNAGETSKDITVTANDDDVDDDGESVNLAFGMLPEGVSVGSPASAVVELTDNDTAGVMLDKTDLVVTEGGSTTYKVALDSQPTADVTVTITGHAGTDLTLTPTTAMLTFMPSTWNRTQTVTVAAGDDGDALNDSALLTHRAVGATEYASVTASLSVTVTDDDTRATGAPAITGIAEVGEELTANTSGITDGDGLNNVSYEFQWVRVASGGLETDISGATSDTYTVQAADVGDAFKLRVAFTDDKGNPESLTSAPTAVVTVAQVKVSFGLATYGAAEGGPVAEVQIVLDKDPHRRVSISLNAVPSGGATPGDYRVEPSQIVFNAGETSKDVTVTAVDDNVDDDGESVELTFGVLSAGVSLGATTRAVVQIADNDGKGIVLSPTSLGVTEGGSATYTVALASQPTADVAVTIAGHSGTDLRLNRTSLTFTTSDWNREQSVMASAVEDSDSNNDSATLTHTANGGGYTGVTAALAVTVTDNDSQAMGAPIIDGLPEVGETLTADTSQIMDADGLSRPGYRYQWVRVASEGVETDIPRATSATYRVIADDVGAALKVEATFTDDKGNPESAESTASAAVTVAQVVATFGSGPYAAEEGRSARVRVSLDKNPLRTVTIPLMAAPRDGADPGDYTVPTEVVFNAGETSKDVTVTVIDDSVDDDGESVELTFGGLPVGVSEGATTLAVVRITDNDGRGIALSSTSLSVTEGGTARTYTVALATQPTTTVTVTITGHLGTDVSLDNTVLYFTPSDWSRAQSIRVSADQDPDLNNDSATLTHTASGADYDSVKAAVTVTVVDDDRAQPPVTRGGGGGGFGPAPVAPSFMDGFRTARAVAANARPGDAVGEPVSATHPDELVIAYTLSGTDAASFAVDEETGQIRVKEGVDLTIGRTYTINLTATDSAGFGAIIIVMIEVTEASFSPYDRNGNDSIERDEVIMAVADYFKGSIDKEDVIEVIKLYFAG